MDFGMYLIFHIQELTPLTWKGNLSFVIARGSFMLARAIRFAREYPQPTAYLPALGKSGIRLIRGSHFEKYPSQAYDAFQLEYERLLSTVGDLISVTQLALAHATQSPIKPCELSMIKCTLLKALIAQALLQRSAPHTAGWRSAAVESVNKFVLVTDALTHEDFAYIDVGVGVSYPKYDSWLAYSNGHPPNSPASCWHQES